MVKNHLHDYAQLAFVSGVKKILEILKGAVEGMNRSVIGDVISIIAQRRREKGHQPDRIDSQIAKVIQLLSQALEVADTVPSAVVERADVHLLKNGVFVPKRVRRL